MRALSVFLFVAGASFAASAQQYGSLQVLRELAGEFSDAVQENVEEASASLQERVGETPKPGIFLHPRSEGDAILRFDGLELPSIASGEELFLLFFTGLRDGIDWSTQPNGVQFSVYANGKEVFQAINDAPDWKPGAARLSEYASAPLSLSFRTNAIQGNTNYDWAVFGDPILVRFTPSDQNETIPDIALTPLPDGTVNVTETDSATETTILANYNPKPEWGNLDLSSPFGTVGQPIRVLQTVRNAGRGVWHGTLAQLLLHARDPGSGTGIIKQQINRVTPGGIRRINWIELTPDEVGRWRAQTITPDTPGQTREIEFTVFPDRGDPDNQATPLLTQDNTARLLLYQNDLGDAYLSGDVWRDGAWQTAVDIYPLLEGVWPASHNNTPDNHPFILEHIEKPSAKTKPITLSGNIGGHPAALELNSLGNGRFMARSILGAATTLDLYAFRGPQLLAWNHTLGPEKDFTLFGGLEYLEGDEHSSSTRDLAYPLNQREVPAIYKIASPVMAVEKDNILVSMLWDPKQEWQPNHPFPAARFRAPKPSSKYNHVSMALAAPSIGDDMEEHAWHAARPYPLPKGQKIVLEQHIVLDAGSKSSDPGEALLNAYDHYFELYGRLPASQPPQGWPQTKQLALDGYFDAVWNEDPPGFSHCHGWEPGLLTGHIVPLLMLKEDGVPAATAEEIDRRTNAVLNRAIETRGPEYLWTPTGCHIVHGELPFYVGYLPEALAAMRTQAQNLLKQREDGLWRWHPGGEKYSKLGTDGDHTLGQAARNAFVTLRAARLSAAPELAREALSAMEQMELYRVPRGAQTWECPLYQPDILAAGYAIRAYCEAYRLTGDSTHLEKAHYWAKTGLPFLYLWEMKDFPTMRHNVISVMGSTFFTHSWIGLPVVWCGLVYAYALQDYNELAGDTDFNWNDIARGITHSAMWQQYTEGPNRGTYPDSWDMVENEPRPADINPENIVMNAMRLRGKSPEVNAARIQVNGRTVLVNSPATITVTSTAAQTSRITLEFNNTHALPVYAVAGPLPDPRAIEGVGERLPSSATLAPAETGWLHVPDLNLIVVKLSPSRSTRCTIDLE